MRSNEYLRNVEGMTDRLMINIFKSKIQETTIDPRSLGEHGWKLAISCKTISQNLVG